MKLPMKPLHLDDLRAAMDGDARLGRHPGEEFGQIDLRIWRRAPVGRSQGSKVPELAAQLGLALHQVDVVTLLGERQRGGDPGRSPAEDQGRRLDLHLLPEQRLERGDAGDRHADELPRLDRGQEAVVGVDPRALIADVGHRQQVFVEAGLPQAVLEKWTVGEWRAGGDDDPVQVVFGDAPLDGGGAVLRAGVQQVVGVDDPRQAGGVGGDRFDIDEAGDVRSAVADEDAHARSLRSKTSRSGGYSIVRARSPRAAARRAAAEPAAPLASMTDSGMSFGSRKGPTA